MKLILIITILLTGFSFAQINDSTKSLKEVENKSALADTGSNVLPDSLKHKAAVDTLNPLYQKAQATLHDAELNLARTTVKAPVDGMIGTAPQIGDYAREGVPLLNLVGSNDVWIEANYKETELTDVKIGQPVTIEVDTYPGHEWQGHVDNHFTI